MKEETTHTNINACTKKKKRRNECIWKQKGSRVSDFAISDNKKVKTTAVKENSNTNAPFKLSNRFDARLSCVKHAHNVVLATCYQARRVKFVPVAPKHSHRVLVFFQSFPARFKDAAAI